MKIRAQGVGGRWTSRPGALLVHPRPGLEMLALHDCVVVPDLTAIGSPHEHTDVIVDSPWQEEIDDALEHADELLETTADEITLTLLLPPDRPSTIEQVVGSRRGRGLSVTVVETRPERTIICLARAHDSDRPIDDFATGLRLSDLSTAAACRQTVHRLREDNGVLRRKLVDLLTYSLASSGDRPASGSAPDPRSGSDPQTVRRLEDEIVKLTRQRDALQRKYTALAESRLGRITLDRWERKRRRR